MIISHPKTFIRVQEVYANKLVESWCNVGIPTCITYVWVVHIGEPLHLGLNMFLSWKMW